jgi:hypothetical protein
VRFLIACAPSQAIRKSDIDPDRAIPFIRQSFPGLFLEEPSLSLPQQGVKFTVASGGSPSDGFAWAWANGRVDLTVDIQLDCEPDQRFAIPIVDVLRPIVMMAAAVSGRGYTKVYGKTRTRLRRRFDWFIGVSMTYTHPSAYTIAWDDITFPGRRPPRAGSGQDILPTRRIRGSEAAELEGGQFSRGTTSDLPRGLPQTERIPRRQ